MLGACRTQNGFSSKVTTTDRKSLNVLKYSRLFFKYSLSSGLLFSSIFTKIEVFLKQKPSLSDVVINKLFQSFFFLFSSFLFFLLSFLLSVEKETQRDKKIMVRNKMC